MAQRSGFFNALYVDGTYDRKYNANDYCDNLAVVISNGVLRSESDDLKVTADGMRATVSAGRAWINGRYYVNDSPIVFAAVTAPIGGKRWDRVFLRLNNEVSDRRIYLVYVKGNEANTPVKPAPKRTENVYDLVLADIYVDTNATSVIVTDTRSDPELCGWVYSTSGDNSFFTTLDNSFNEWFGNTRDTLSSVTLFKRYNWRTTLPTAAKQIAFSIPQWDEETCFLEVYVNGVLEHDGVDYTLDGAKSIVTFTGTLVAGTEIIVKVYKSIDGTGIESVADEITKLQNAVAALNSEADYVYHCNGIDDNVKLSKIASEWLNGGADYGSKIVRVYGNFGCSAAYGGAGTAANPYRWFEIGTGGVVNRRIVFDFSGCGEINLPIAANTYNTVFYGYNAHIIGANLYVSQTGVDTVVKCFSSTNGAIRAENCRFLLYCYKDSMIANGGTFVNCFGFVANATNNSYCFSTYTGNLLRIEGGEYYAYTGSSSAQSAVIGQSAANAVSILNGVNAPTVARSGFYQTNSLLQWVGGGEVRCADLVSALPIIVVAGIAEIRGTIEKSKPNSL